MNRVCLLTLDDKQELLYDKVENQWKKYLDNPNYTESEYCEWVADNKDGVSNFELHPSLLPRRSIGHKVFHFECLIGKD